MIWTIVHKLHVHYSNNIVLSLSLLINNELMALFHTALPIDQSHKWIYALAISSLPIRIKQLSNLIVHGRNCDPHLRQLETEVR